MRHVIRFMATAMIILMAACNDDASTAPEDPIIEGTAQGKVILPAGSAIALAGLRITTLEEERTAGADGAFTAKVKTQHARPTLVMASTADGEPVLLGFTRGTGTTNLDVTSTAAALAALAINIVPLDAALRARPMRRSHRTVSSRHSKRPSAMPSSTIHPRPLPVRRWMGSWRLRRRSPTTSLHH